MENLFSSRCGRSSSMSLAPTSPALALALLLTTHSVGENHWRSIWSRSQCKDTQYNEINHWLSSHSLSWPFHIHTHRKIMPMAPFASLHFPSFRLSITFKLDIYHWSYSQLLDFPSSSSQLSTNHIFNKDKFNLTKINQVEIAWQMPQLCELLVSRLIGESLRQQTGIMFERDRDRGEAWQYIQHSASQYQWVVFM